MANERDDNEYPMSISCGQETRGNICLTHALWCPVTLAGRSEQPETGVRRLDIPRGEHGHFELIQHGCPDWPAVTDTIFRGLAKGWTTDRIGDFIRNFRDRRRPRARFA